MPNDAEAVDTILDDELAKTLCALADLIIPACEERGLPGAADVGIVAYVQNEGHNQWVIDGLTSIVEGSREVHDKEFFTLTPSEQGQLIDRLRRKQIRFFINIANIVVECYYQNDDVLVALGLEARAPFPEGYVVEEGDLTLLEPVYERGKIYRD